MMEVQDASAISRQEAKSLGLKKYSTGQPCNQGHVSPRRVSNGKCCQCAKDGGLAWRADNPDYAAESAQRWRNDNPERMIKLRADWDKENAERKKEVAALYRQNNKDKTAHRNRRWVDENPEKARANWMRRWAREHSAPGHHTAEDIERIGAAQRWKCGWCGVSCRKKYHVDHINPLSCGGSNDPSNLLISCPKCNISKKNKDPIDFAQKLGKLL